MNFVAGTSTWLPRELERRSDQQRHEGDGRWLMMQVHRLSSRSSRRRGESLSSSSVEVRADLATAGQATDGAAVHLPKIDSISPLVPSDTSPTPRKATSP
jgi:hypothetical protein